MKKLVLLLILLSLISCREEEGVWDELTAAERLALQQRASQKCLAGAASHFLKISETSNIEMAKYKRGDFWKVTVPGTSTADYLYVWKVTSSVVYFLYQQKQGTTTYHQFIKMTPTFNGEMIADLRVQKCAAKIPVITQSSTSFSVKYVDALSTEGTTKYRTDTTYTGLDDHPAFYSIFSQKIFKEKLDTDNNVVSSENLTYSIAYEGNDAELLTSFSLYSNRKYCVFKYTTAVLKTFVFPFELSCTETDGVNPNTFGDATLDFTSANL